MEVVLNSWKEAATLILIAKTSNINKFGSHMDSSTITSFIRDSQTDQDQVNLSGDITDKDKVRQNKILNMMNKTDYRIMMVKRSGLSSFMASAYVFPGGAFETVDFSSNWWRVFEKANISRERALEVVNRVKGHRPEIITESVTFNDYIETRLDEKDSLLPLDIALRVAAIRETFEETGVLLLANNENDKLIPLSDQDDLKINLSDWREKVRNDASTFIELCLELKKCPDIWSLYEWSNYLTPTSVGHKRFDTMFYICCLESIPKVIIDNREVTNLKWITPIEMLEEHTQERVFLAPPQVYELSRFYSFKSYEEFKQYVIRREVQGCERWLPIINTYIDGAVSALPGDEMYPEVPDLIGKKPVQDYPKKLKDLISPGSKLNRIELRGPTSVALVNVESKHGHPSPVSYYRNNEELIQNELNSKL